MLSLLSEAKNLCILPTQRRRMGPSLCSGWQRHLRFLFPALSFYLAQLRSYLPQFDRGIPEASLPIKVERLSVWLKLTAHHVALFPEEIQFRISIAAINEVIPLLGMCASV
jgi:hypothetical protein